MLYSYFSQRPTNAVCQHMASRTYAHTVLSTSYHLLLSLLPWLAVPTFSDTPLLDNPDIQCHTKIDHEECGDPVIVLDLNKIIVRKAIDAGRKEDR